MYRITTHPLPKRANDGAPQVGRCYSFIPRFVQLEPGFALLLSKHATEQDKRVILFTALPAPMDADHDHFLFDPFLASDWGHFMRKPYPFVWDMGDDPYVSLKKVSEEHLIEKRKKQVLSWIAEGVYRYIPYDPRALRF